MGKLSVGVSILNLWLFDAPGSTEGNTAAVNPVLHRAPWLRDAGVQLRAALPVGLLRTLVGRTDLRLHRKIVVIDGLAAWTGSMNLVDPRYFKQNSGVGEWSASRAR